MGNPEETKFSEVVFFVGILILVGYFVVTKKELLDLLFFAFISLNFFRYIMIKQKRSEL